MEGRKNLYIKEQENSGINLLMPKKYYGGILKPNLLALNSEDNTLILFLFWIFIVIH